MFNVKKKLIWQCIFMTVLLCLLAIPMTYAQEGSDNNFMLEEITVTAEKRETTVQKTPIPISATTNTELTKKAKFTLDEVVRDSPGLLIQANNAGAQIYIRGIGNNNVGFGDPTINLNIDGVYQQDQAPVTSGLFDVSRIEVLRGPQGTLYGRNATAGSINVITNDPVLNQFEGYASLSVGNYDSMRTEGALNVPINDSVAVRGAFFTNRHDGYIEPSGYDDADQVGARVKMLYDTSDTFRFVLTGSLLTENGEGSGTVNTGIDDRSDPWYAVRYAGHVDHEFWDLRGQLDWNLGPATLTVIPAYTYANRYDNISNLPASIINPAMTESPTAEEQFTKQTTIEARVASNNNEPFSWVAGLYYLDGEFIRNNLVYRIYLPQTTLSDPSVNQTQPVQSFASFGQVTYSLTDFFRITGGLRYTDESKEQINDYISLTTEAVTSTSSGETKWNSLDYKLGVEMDLTPTSLLYVSASTAFKAGGYSTRVPIGVAAVPYDPEELQSYEIGSKNRYLNNRLQLNASGFYYDYKKYQARFPVFIDSQLHVITANAASAEIYGGEFEMLYQFTKSDLLTANLAYTHAEFGTFQYTDVSGPRDFSGQTLPNAPDWTSTIGYEHTWDFRGGATFTASVQSKISSGFWSTVERTLDTYQSGYHMTDVSLLYDTPIGENHWTFRLYVKNIEEEPVRAGGGLAGPDRGFVFLQPPRTIGASISASF